ncbi:hypothetical protein Nepgr_011747 [Nepenthes gracilis]|uniref:Uncharacterized protein n=1 Tax=Nepenthes gracilis TaxID=150966 RepID=A0AAD3SFN0_NEPGR|nr:hypothetical protein Nepgr_011747 [Nepenthes gracilis]
MVASNVGKNSGHNSQEKEWVRRVPNELSVVKNSTSALLRRQGPFVPLTTPRLKKMNDYLLTMLAGEIKCFNLTLFANKAQDEERLHADHFICQPRWPCLAMKK